MELNNLKEYILEISDDIVFIRKNDKTIYQNKENLDFTNFNKQLTELNKKDTKEKILLNVKNKNFYKLNIINEKDTTIYIYKNKTKEINLEIKNTILEKKANTDNLTGLYNRNKMIEELQKIDKYQTNTNDIFIVMIDLDNFKKINDKYGHPIGDIVLKELSKIFINFIKTPNIVSRYGGEEFTIIFFNSEKDEVLNTMEKIRKTVEETKINNEILCTISIGITRYNENYAKTLKTADEALYFVKNNGKNGLCYNNNKIKKIEKKLN